MICVSDYEMEVILDILKKHACDCEIYVFGSRQKWTAKDYSDLDLAFVLPGGNALGVKRVAALQEAFSESVLPYRVDVVDYNAVSTQFKAVIDAEKERVIGDGAKAQWERVRLGDTRVQIIDGDRGKNYPKQFTENGHCLFLSTKNVTSTGFCFKTKQFITQEQDELLRKGKLDRNDIILTTRGTVGNVAFYNDKVPYVRMRINSGMVILRADREFINPYYLYYVMKSAQTQNQILHMRTGSAQPQFPISHMINLEIPTPPLEIQRAIAVTLSALDEKIANNAKINHHLEQMAKAIFKSWFVDFEPWGGVMPDDWREGTFNEVISVTISGDWGKDTPTGNNTQEAYCIRGADIPDVNAGNKGKMPIRYILPKNYVIKQLAVGDIVIEISGGSPTQSTGRCALITQSLLDRYDRGMVCTNFCRAVKPLAGYSPFVYFYWKYLYAQNVMFAYENGTTGIKNLNISGLLETEPIIIPPAKVADQFAKAVGTFIDTVFANGLENETLATSRDTLLPRLMSGELSVANLTVK